MRKIISIVLTVAMVLCMAMPVTFAADSTMGASASAGQTTFSDISGKGCENAVNALVKAGIINGFSDGTFRPDANITRAQACTLISKAFPKLTSSEPGNTNFFDVNTHSWYAEAIAYCAANHIVQGNGNGAFRPNDSVSNYEIITMLVRAKGLADDSNMKWPDDYVATAQGIDMLKGTSLDLSTHGSQAATRGNVSIMLYVVADIASDQPSDSSDSTKPSNPSVPSDTDTTDTDYFSGKSGNAYGFITSAGRALDDKGNDVGMIEFFMQGKTYTLLERSSSAGAVSGFGPESGLVRVTLSNGRIKEIHAMSEYAFSGAIPSDKSGYPYTITQNDPSQPLHFYQITNAGKTYAYYNEKGNASDSDYSGTYIGINDPCVVYTCTADGSDIKYELGSSADVAAGSYIAAFAIDKDSAGVADVVLVVDESDAADLLKKAEGTLAAYIFK